MMEERMLAATPFEVEDLHPFRAGENGLRNCDVSVSIWNSPPLTYESTRQHANGMDSGFTQDLAPNRQPGLLSLSAALKIPKLPLNGRSRPLPTPVQPKMSPASGCPAVLSQTAVPVIPTHLHRPPPALCNTRRRPLPQPGVISTTAPPTTLSLSTHLSTSLTSSVPSSSHLSHSRSGSSTSNAPSLCTTSSYSYPHSSSSYQTSFASMSRASTLPVSTIQAPRNLINQVGLALPRRAETQPSSAPPITAGFIIDAEIVPRQREQQEMMTNEGKIAPGEDGKARPLPLGNKTTAQSKLGVKACPEDANVAPFAFGDSTILSASGTTTATSKMPFPPPLDFPSHMSPIQPFSDFNGGSFITSDEIMTIDQITETANELGLTGMSNPDFLDSNVDQGALPSVFHLPPPPAGLPPIPPHREIAPMQPTTTAPSNTAVSLKPLNVGSHTTKKNRPVLTIQTWDLHPKPKSKKEQHRRPRANPPLPINQSGKELQIPVMRDQVQSRNSVHPGVKITNETHQDGTNNGRASFLPSMGFASKVACTSDVTASGLMAPTWGDAFVAKDSIFLGAAPSAHLEPSPSKSSGVITTRLRKMRVLHRKSKSFTEWTWNGTLDVAGGTLQGRPEPTNSIPSTSVAQSRSLFGSRHPYGYQQGPATCSLTSVGASMPTASGSGMTYSVSPRPETLYSNAPPPAFLPSHQPNYAQAFRMAPLPPTPLPAESKKTMGALWTKLRFGGSRKTTNTAPKKRSGAVDLW